MGTVQHNHSRLPIAHWNFSSFPGSAILPIMTVLTNDRCRPRAHLQGERIGHLNHLFLRGWQDGLCLIRAAKDHWDIKAKPEGQVAGWTKCEREWSIYVLLSALKSERCTHKNSLLKSFIFCISDRTTLICFGFLQIKWLLWWLHPILKSNTS